MYLSEEQNQKLKGKAGKQLPTLDWTRISSLSKIPMRMGTCEPLFLLAPRNWSKLGRAFETSAILPQSLVLWPGDISCSAKPQLLNQVHASIFFKASILSQIPTRVALASAWRTQWAIRLRFFPADKARWWVLVITQKKRKKKESNAGKQFLPLNELLVEDSFFFTRHNRTKCSSDWGWVWRIGNRGFLTFILLKIWTLFF